MDIKLLRLSLSISFNLFRKYLNLFHICTLFVRLAAAQAVCLQLCMCRTSPSIHGCLELFFTGTRGIHWLICSVTVELQMDQASFIWVEWFSEVLRDLLLFVISDRRALKSACLKLYTTLGIFRLLQPERLSLNVSIEWSVSKSMGHSKGSSTRFGSVVNTKSRRLPCLLNIAY